MTLYFAGGEDLDFVNTGYAMSTSGSTFRSAYSRGSLSSGFTSSSALPPNPNIATGQIGPLTSFWVHAQMFPSSNAAALNVVLLDIADASGVDRLLLRGTGTAGQIKISTRNAAGTITDLVTSAAGAIPAATAPVAFDFFVNYAASGQATLYIGGVNVCDTGAAVNITTDSVTSLGDVLFGELNGNFFTWSEVIVQSTSTLGAALQTLPPVAAGATQSWTPNTVGNVNPLTINDANFVAATAASALSEWTVATALPAGSWTIEAVVQSARVSAGTTGPQHFAWLVRTSDLTDHTIGSVAPPVGSFGNARNIWLTNPHTGLAWNAGELINAGIESLA